MSECTKFRLIISQEKFEDDQIYRIEADMCLDEHCDLSIPLTISSVTNNEYAFRQLIEKFTNLVIHNDQESEQPYN